MGSFYKPQLFHVLFVFAIPSSQARDLLQWKNTIILGKNSLSESFLYDTWSLNNLVNLCNWTGIACNTARTVSELNIGGEELPGKRPHFSFSSFPNLTSSDLSYNYLSDGIPVDIENLTQLSFLSLEHNYFKGTVPCQINHLHKFQHLDLRFNYLVEPYWPMFSFTCFRISIFRQELNFLHLSLYMWAGYIPESMFTHLANFEYLSLYFYSI